MIPHIPWDPEGSHSLAQTPFPLAREDMDNTSLSAPRVMVAHPAGSLLFIILLLPTIALPGFSCRKSAVSSQSWLGKLGSYSPPAAAAKVTPHDHPKLSCQLLGCRKPPKRGGNSMASRRIFIRPTRTWEKPRMGISGCGSTFLKGVTSGIYRCATGWWGGCWC